METLNLRVKLPLKAQNAGLCVSRGQGQHPTRTIDSFELIFVREGELGMQEEGREFRLSAGHSLLLYPGREHGGTSPYTPDLAYYWIHFTVEAEADRDTGDLLSVEQHRKVARPDNLVTLFHRFLEEQESETLSQLTSSIMLVQMMAEVVAEPAATQMPESAAAVLANRADAYIRTHFHNDISTAAIADYLGCSADYLGRAFRSVYGLSIVDAIHRRRMHHARLLLMMGKQNVDEVSRACGFVDCGYFRRIFKRHEGMTPLRFQRLHVRTHVNTE